MPKIYTGEFRVILYDKYGTPLKKKKIKTFTSYVKARNYVIKQTSKNKATSGTIDRRLYNSIDQKQIYK